MLSKRGAEILAGIERMMNDANRAMPPLPSSLSADKEKQARTGRKGDALASTLEGRAFERN